MAGAARIGHEPVQIQRSRRRSVGPLSILAIAGMQPREAALITGEDFAHGGLAKGFEVGG